MPQILLHITDCHLVPTDQQLLHTDTQSALNAVLAQAMREARPDAIVATGDLVHSGGIEVYQQFLSTVESHCAAPLLCLPGNHDRAASMAEAGLPMQSLSLGDWFIGALDSHKDDVPEAHVDEAARAVFRAQWQLQTARYGLLATHHPLLPIGSPWLDKDRIDAPESLLDGLIESESPEFCGAIFGHAHQVIDGRYRQRPLLGTPSTGFQFEPRSQQFAVANQPPGYRWLTLTDSGQIESQVGWLK